MSKKEITIEEEGLDLIEKMKKLQTKLKKYKKEKEEYLIGWQRTKADFINARKEEDKKREEFAKLSNQFLISELLVVLDSFDLALKNGDNTGFSMIKNQLDSILQKFGLETIKAMGKQFNPQFHEAIEEIESKEKNGTVIEEIQKGYTLHEKIIRAARVKIAK